LHSLPRLDIGRSIVVGEVVGEFDVVGVVSGEVVLEVVAGEVVADEVVAGEVVAGIVVVGG